jgi:hypothetical protein
MKGVTSSREGFRIFHRRLQNLVSSKGINSTKQSIYILSCVKTLVTAHGVRWETEKDWEQWNREFGDIPSPLDYGENTAKDQVVKHHSEMVGCMEAYFDCLPELAERVQMRHEAVLTVDEVEDAWLSMIFRAFCWQRSHVMIPEVAPLPSEYWNSKMPVYFG